MILVTRTSFESGRMLLNEIGLSSSTESVIVVNDIERVSEVTMYDFEVKMRKLISDLLTPSIEKMAQDRDCYQVLTK